MDRFEGKVQVTNLTALKVAAQAMSDNQLQTYFNVFKLGGLRAQKEVIVNEMSIRVIAEYLAAAYLILHPRA